MQSHVPQEIQKAPNFYSLQFPLLLSWFELDYKSRRNKSRALWINSYAERESKRVLFAAEKK